MSKLETISQKYDLKYFSKEKIALGQIKGVPCSISSTEYNYLFNLEINVNIKASGKMADLTHEVKAKAKMFKSVMNFVLSDYSIKAQINVSSNKKMDELEEVFSYLSALISENGLRTCCTACGEATPTETFCVNKEARQICPACAAEIVNTIESAEIENRGKKGSVLLGVVGSFIGAIIGGILWIIVYQIGYVAAIVGIVAVICAYKGYTLFSGKKDIKAAIISVIMAAAVLFLAHCLCLSIVISTEFGVSFFEAVAATPAILAEPEIFGEFMLDLLYGYIFMAVGAFAFIKNAIKNPTGKAEFKRIETSSTEI